MPRKKFIPLISIIPGIALLVGLYVLSRVNYLLFHSLVEIYSIIVAAGIFIVSWNTKKFSQNTALSLLGIAYAYIAFLDLFHTLTYVGMNIFPGEHFFANQLWIVARAIESISILLFVSGTFSRWKKPFPLAFTLYGILSLVGILSIIAWEIFPPAFIAGQGQTPFKIASEICIIIILFVSLFFLYQKRESYKPVFWRLMVFSIVFTILSELSFTLYTDNYGVTNVFGHIFKVISFYLIYRSMIVNMLQHPYQLLFSDLVNKQQELLEANQTKEKFFGIIAHDLCNPFNVIISSAELLKNDLHAGSSENAAEYTDYILNSAQNTHRLLENLLSWARLQTGNMPYQPQTLQLAEILEKQVSFLQEHLKQKKIQISIDETSAIPVHADKNMLDTILRNLITNAIKFTPIGGNILLSAKRDAKGVCISIRDTGIGMSNEHAQELFNPSTKTQRPGTENESGTGLGLILCKEFVETHGGTIWVNSREKQGTTISFRLPATDSLVQ